MITSNKIQNIGNIYRLTEQFELISRTDLAKLSGLAPASITNITKQLIDKQFILERSVQDCNSRGRPAVGLSVSTFFWKQLCLTIFADHLTISLCKLDGSVIHRQDYTFSLSDYPNLDEIIAENLQNFRQNQPLNDAQILALSIAVVGHINAEKNAIVQLGQHFLKCRIVEKLQAIYSQPILLNEHFHLWLLAESTLGSLIGDDNVIFLQVDDAIRLSILLRGALLHEQNMNVDHMLMPRFSTLSDEIYPELDSIERYQLNNQASLQALIQLIDKHLPKNFEMDDEHLKEAKITHFCEQVEAKNPTALAILEHISSNLAYMLMNLVNIFSTEKILFDSPLLRIKAPLFEQITQKLNEKMLNRDLNMQLVTSHFDKNSTLIPCAMIKQGIYEGSLIKNIIPD